jgi:uncharacterized membrane protein HdeD (DUF308 family)
MTHAAARAQFGMAEALSDAIEALTIQSTEEGAVTFQSSTDADATRAIHDHWELFLAEGAALLVLGLAAIAVPFIAGNVSIFFLGWIFLLAGVVGLISTLQGRNAPGFGWSLLSAIVALLVAAVLLLNPLQSLASLPHNLTTLAHLLTLFFIIDGFLMIVYAVSHRREQSGWWELLLVHGVVDFALAGFLLTGLPDSALWALALLVGLDLAFGGLTLVVMAWEARKGALAIG